MKIFQRIAIVLCALASYVCPAYTMNQKTACEPGGSIAPLRFNLPAQAAVLNANLTPQEIKQRYQALEDALASVPVHPETISLLALTVKEGKTPCIDQELHRRVMKKLIRYKEGSKKLIMNASKAGRAALQAIQEELPQNDVSAQTLQIYLTQGLLASNAIKLFGIEPSFEKDLLAFVDPIRKALNLEQLNQANH